MNENWARAIFVMTGVICIVVLVIMAKISEIVNWIKGKGLKL